MRPSPGAPRFLSRVRGRVRPQYPVYGPLLFVGFPAAISGLGTMNAPAVEYGSFPVAGGSRSPFSAKGMLGDQGDSRVFGGFGVRPAGLEPGTRWDYEEKLEGRRFKQFQKRRPFFCPPLPPVPMVSMLVGRVCVEFQ
jgi:hypothetical protein